MSEDTENQIDEDEGPVGGERLRAARRANDISVRDVAKELHLDEPKVRAMEKNDFEALGAPVFAKGHLRKYAEFVGVSIDDVMTDYYKMTRATSMPPVLGPTRKLPREINAVPWIAGIVIVLVLGGHRGSRILVVRRARAGVGYPAADDVAGDHRNGAGGAGRARIGCDRRGAGRANAAGFRRRTG